MSTIVPITLRVMYLRLPSHGYGGIYRTIEPFKYADYCVAN